MRAYNCTNLVAQRLATAVATAEQDLQAAQVLLRLEQQACPHQYVPDKPYDPAQYCFSSRGRCAICGFRLAGWWCPKGPEGSCNYNHPDGTVRFNCVRCHGPRERK